MKKSLIFASLVAFMAIAAVSCKKEAVDAPKPRFTYDASGLVVTFTNQSENADSFVWEFGDGANSTEKNPVHTYADYGTYTVKLTAKNAGSSKSISDDIVLEKQAVQMTIDGNFEDWTQVPANLLAASVIEDEEDANGLYAIKFCTDATFVYFYIEYDGDPDLNVDIISMMIDQDDNPATGFASYLWDNAGTEVLLQGSISEGYENCPIYKFAEGADQDVWDGNWDDTGATGAIKISEIKVGNNNRKAFEGSIRRSYLPNPNGPVFKVGVYVDDADWNELGSLPAITLDDEGLQIVPELLNVPLN